MLRHQFTTLLVAISTLVLTVYLYIVIPKGFFPIQDTGVIQGISQSAQAVSFPAMSRQQQQLARIILQDPGGGEPVVVHRRRRHEHDAQQRARC